MEPTKTPTGPNSVVQTNGSGTEYREVKPAPPSIDEIIEALEKRERRRPQKADSPIDGSSPVNLWALVPKNQRHWILFVLILFGGSSGTWMLNLSAIWGLPSEVQELRHEVSNLKKDIEEIKGLLTKEPVK